MFECRDQRGVGGNDRQPESLPGAIVSVETRALLVGVGQFVKAVGEFDAIGL